MGALDGIRVIDFGQYIAGPLAAVMLADEGADVIHVDPPGGPSWKSDADAFFNRGKRRISLDLKSARGLDDAQRLIDSADVVIENFRPSVMDRLGLGAGEMTARNPGLIYCSLPGFAPDDPRAHMRAWEGILDAATENCFPRAGEPPDDLDCTRPTYSAVPLASNFGGFCHWARRSGRKHLRFPSVRLARLARLALYPLDVYRGIPKSRLSFHPVGFRVPDVQQRGAADHWRRRDGLPR